MGNHHTHCTAHACVHTRTGNRVRRYDKMSARDLSMGRDFGVLFLVVSIPLIFLVVLDHCGQCCKSLSRTVVLSMNCFHFPENVLFHNIFS